MPFPVTGRLHRIDRIHPIAGGDQGLNPWATVGFDPDQHLGDDDLTCVGVNLFLRYMLGNQRVQLRDPIDALR